MSKPFKLVIVTVVIVMAGLILTILSSSYIIKSSSEIIIPEDGISSSVCIGSNLNFTSLVCGGKGSVVSKSGFPLQYYSANQQNFIPFLLNKAETETKSQFSTEEFALDWLAWSLGSALVIGILLKLRKK